MNNEQVIKYISDHSKNPHAAMMVEQLLTGWDVEYLTNNEEWVTATRPNWSPAVKYRLVKPKQKPAYRVYRFLTGKNTHTQERDSQGIESALPDGAIILQSWKEYDPEPKQWPTPLVERIAAIDLDAANWIVKQNSLV